MKMRKWAIGITFRQQWTEWFKVREYNWINFAPIHIELEAGKYKGHYAELTLRLLGLGLWIEVYDKEEREAFAREIQDQIPEIFGD